MEISLHPLQPDWPNATFLSLHIYTFLGGFWPGLDLWYHHTFFSVIVPNELCFSSLPLWLFYTFSLIKLLPLPLLPLLSVVDIASKLKGKMQFIKRGLPSFSTLYPQRFLFFVFCFISLHLFLLLSYLKKVLTLFPKNSFTRFCPLFPLRTLFYNDDISCRFNFFFCWLFPPSIWSCSNLFHLKANN